MNNLSLIQKLSYIELLQAMVEGALTSKHKIVTSKFGSIENGKCTVCIATAAIAYITKASLSTRNVVDPVARAKAFGLSFNELCQVDNALDYLRHGMIDMYNPIAGKYGLPAMPNHLKLPGLYTETYLTDLQEWKQVIAQELTPK